MPPVSKSQSRFFRGVASGSIRKPGLSREKAQEFVAGYSTKNLPEKKKPKKAEKADGKKLQRKRQMLKSARKGSVHGAYD